MLEQHRDINKDINTPPSKEKGVVFPKIPFRAKGLTWSVKTNFNGGPSRRRKPYQVTLWSWMAAFIDACLLLGLSILFLIVFSKIVQMPALSVFKTVRSQGDYLVLLGKIYFVCSWFYLVFLRSFFAGTIGEYACDLRLGHPGNANTNKYIWKVILRSSLTVGTGLVVLPICSLIVGFDIAGRISGIKLFSVK